MEQTPFSLDPPLAAPDPPTDTQPDLGRRRGFPFIWVTWLSGLLSGDSQCWWRVWVKTHRQGYVTRPDPDQSRLDQWKAEHAMLVRERLDVLRAAGERVTVEDENELKIKGQSAILMGKPDIVVHLPTHKRVEDLKGGDARPSDVFQVRIYGAMQRMALAARNDDTPVTGLVVYRHERVEVTQQQIADTRPLLSDAIRRLADGHEPSQVPSAFECGRCDIAACPKRYVEQPPVTTEEF
jgi:hypothetical protein